MVTVGQCHVWLSGPVTVCPSLRTRPRLCHSVSARLKQVCMQRATPQLSETEMGFDFHNPASSVHPPPLTHPLTEQKCSVRANRGTAFCCGAKKHKEFNVHPHTGTHSIVAPPPHQKLDLHNFIRWHFYKNSYIPLLSALFHSLPSYFLHTTFAIICLLSSPLWIRVPAKFVISKCQFVSRRLTTRSFLDSL